MLCDVCLTQIDMVTTELSHQLRNPLAFAHGKLNLLAAQIMSKPALISLIGNSLWSARTCPRFQKRQHVAALLK
jgi:signal transduction histidine kinase